MTSGMDDPWEDVREILKRIEEVRNMGLKANPSKRILTRVLTDADALLSVAGAAQEIREAMIHNDETPKAKKRLQDAYGTTWRLIAALPEHLKDKKPRPSQNPKDYGMSESDFFTRTEHLK